MNAFATDANAVRGVCAPPINILILEDVSTDAKLMEWALRQADVAFVSKRVDTRSAFVEVLETFKPDVLLSDVLPDFSCREIVDHVRHTHPEVPVVIVTDLLGVEAAIELLKAGARDYVPKSELWRLPLAVAHVISVEVGIRARKAAEQASRESNNLLKTTERIAHVGGWHWDAVHDAVVWSDEMYCIFGLDPNGLVRDVAGFLGLVHPDDRQRVQKAIVASTTRGAPFELEHRLVRPDGIERIVHVRAELGFDSAGNTASMTGTCQDVTEARLGKQKIREEEAKFHSLVEQNVTGVMMIRQDATIAYINPYWARLNGYTAEETLGHSIFEYILEPEKTPVSEQLAEQFSGAGGFIQLATSMLAKDGHQIDLLFNASPGIYEGQPVSIAVLLDITERKRAEQGLRSSEERFRLLVEEAPDAILLYDFDQNRFISANKAAERLFACGREEIVEYGPQHFYPPEQPDRRAMAQSFAEHNQRALAGEEITYERRILNAAGEERLCEVTLVRLPSETGRLLRASFVDVTEQRRAELAMQRSLEATVGAIANTIEMRDPYTAGHQRRVAKLAIAIARELHLPDHQIEGLYLAGIIHDVGKINIPAEILSKSGKLSKLEYQLIQRHAEAGYEIIKGIDFPWPIAEMVRQHHERLDGSGYPRGLVGEQILLEARILAVADVVESMMSHRPYRPSSGTEAALAEIQAGKGRHYDPAPVEACLALVREKGFSF